MVEDSVISKVAPLAVRNRQAQNGSRPCGICERAVVAFDTGVHVLANKVQSAVSDERAWEQPRLTKNLKTVANADDEPSVRGEASHGAHNR